MGSRGIGQGIHLLWFALLVSAGIFVSSCSIAGGGVDSAAASADEPTGSQAPPVTAVIPEVVDPGPVGGQGEAEALAAYEEFESVRWVAMAGDDEESDRLWDLAAAPVVDQVSDQIEGFVRSVDAMDLEVTVSRESNVERTVLSDDGAVSIYDCVEIRQDEPTGVLRPVRFLYQRAIMRNDGDGATWRVDLLSEVHSGLGSDFDPFGCVPRKYRERLAGFVDGFVASVVQAERDPQLTWPDSWDGAVDNDATADVRESLASAPRPRFQVGPVTARVFGATSDTRSDGYRTAVAVCFSYPDGKVWEWVDDGERVVEEPFLPGAEVVVVVTVESEPDGEGGFVDRVVRVGSPSVDQCWARGDQGGVLSWD